MGWTRTGLKGKLSLYDIYETKSQKSRKIFKFLQFRTKRTITRDISRDFDIFRQKCKNPPYTIYTNQNHEYHAKNLIFYSIEQKGLFTDNGRRTSPPQKAPMGSRLTSSLLSVRACGSSQGESPGGGHFSAKIGRFALRERFRVSRVEICPGDGQSRYVHFVPFPVFFQWFSSNLPDILQKSFSSSLPCQKTGKRLDIFLQLCYTRENEEPEEVRKWAIQDLRQETPESTMQEDQPKRNRWKNGIRTTPAAVCQRVREI